MSKHDEYDWVDDPFNDKKAAQQQEQMTSGSKTVIGIGCIFVVIALIALVILAPLGLGEIARTVVS